MHKAERLLGERFLGGSKRAAPRQAHSTMGGSAAGALRNAEQHRRSQRNRRLQHNCNKVAIVDTIEFSL